MKCTHVSNFNYSKNVWIVLNHEDEEEENKKRRRKGEEKKIIWVAKQN